MDDAVDEIEGYAVSLLVNNPRDNKPRLRVSAQRRAAVRDCLVRGTVRIGGGRSRRSVGVSRVVGRFLRVLVLVATATLLLRRLQHLEGSQPESANRVCVEVGIRWSVAGVSTKTGQFD